MTKSHILIVDDERFVRDSLAEMLSAEGFRVATASNGAEALKQLSSGSFDAIVSDLRMQKGDGLQLLSEAKSRAIETPIVLITGVGTVAEAVAAMKAGAFDFLQKPVEAEELTLAVRRAVEHKRLLSEVQHLRDRARSERETASLVGGSVAMNAVRARIAQVAPTDATVLLTGESGTGKELAANEIHRTSRRAPSPIVRVSCAAIPAELFESELFGHRKGAFAGATLEREGRFAEAEGGTLVLDEVGALAKPTQATLLRVLETGEYQVLGESGARFASARVIAITNEDLAAAVKNNAFRADLYYRLNVFPIEMPPLRAHIEDVREIAEHLLARIAGPARRLDTQAVEVLASYGWPGNVRELRNVMERAVILYGASSRSSPSSPSYIDASLVRSLLEAGPSTPPAGRAELHLRRNLDAVEREILLRALAASQGKKKEAAQLLGIDPRNLGYYLRKHAISD
jgi:DNA-binding NtrC family response regulator